jgi:hypothetical protein
VYKGFIEMYNNGYEKMGLSNNKIYSLDHREGPIGGHCVMSNAVKLKTKFSKILKKLNNLY